MEELIAHVNQLNERMKILRESNEKYEEENRILKEKLQLLTAQIRNSISADDHVALWDKYQALLAMVG